MPQYYLEAVRHLHIAERFGDPLICLVGAVACAHIASVRLAGATESEKAIASSSSLARHDCATTLVFLAYSQL